MTEDTPPADTASAGTTPTGMGDVPGTEGLKYLPDLARWLGDVTGLRRSDEGRVAPEQPAVERYSVPVAELRRELRFWLQARARDWEELPSDPERRHPRVGPPDPRFSDDQPLRSEAMEEILREVGFEVDESGHVTEDGRAVGGGIRGAIDKNPWIATTIHPHTSRYR